MLLIKTAILALLLGVNAQSTSTKPQTNVAVNPSGAGHWPQASATYNSINDDPYKVIDGVVSYDSDPENKWTTCNSPHAHDLLSITFPRAHNLTVIVLAIYEDIHRSPAGDIACPAAIEITDGNGNTISNISDFATHYQPNRKNSLPFFSAGETDAINIKFVPQAGYAVGVSEVEIYARADAGDFYDAVDAHMVNAEIVFDENSPVTADGAVVEMSESDSKLDFSGVHSAYDGKYNLRIDYKNNGTSTPSFAVAVNQADAGIVETQNTIGAGYWGVEVMDVQLLVGSNNVTIIGGGNGVFVSGFGIFDA